MIHEKILVSKILYQAPFDAMVLLAIYIYCALLSLWILLGSGNMKNWSADPVGPVQNLFFHIVHNFNFSVPIVQLAGPTGRQGPHSLYAFLWSCQPVWSLSTKTPLFLIFLAYFSLFIYFYNYLLVLFALSYSASFSLHSSVFTLS